jgi:hypothetical protein
MFGANISTVSEYQSEPKLNYFGTERHTKKCEQRHIGKYTTPLAKSNSFIVSLSTSWTENGTPP